MGNIRLEDLPEQLREEIEKEVGDVAGLIQDQTVDNNTAPALPSATARTRRKSQIKRQLRVPNLQQMEVLEPQQFVVSIPDPGDPEEEWDIIVQELSPGQSLLLRDTSFMRSAGAARAKIDALNIDEDDESPDNVEKIRQIYDNENASRDFEEYKVEACLLGIVEPRGLTRDMINKWASNVIDRVYDAINGGNEAVDEVDAFPNENSGAGNTPGNNSGSSGE